MFDRHQYVCHFKPFWEALGGTAGGGATADGRHYAWLYSDLRGHAAESAQMIPQNHGLDQKTHSQHHTYMVLAKEKVHNFKKDNDY